MDRRKLTEHQNGLSIQSTRIVHEIRTRRPITSDGFRGTGGRSPTMGRRYIVSYRTPGSRRYDGGSPDTVRGLSGRESRTGQPRTADAQRDEPPVPFGVERSQGVDARRLKPIRSDASAARTTIIPPGVNGRRRLTATGNGRGLVPRALTLARSIPCSNRPSRRGHGYRHKVVAVVRRICSGASVSAPFWGSRSDWT